MRHSTDRKAARPVRPAAVSKMLSRAWSLPPQRNFAAARYSIGLSGSSLVLSQTAGKETGHA